MTFTGISLSLLVSRGYYIQLQASDVECCKIASSPHIYCASRSLPVISCAGNNPSMRITITISGNACDLAFIRALRSRSERREDHALVEARLGSLVVEWSPGAKRGYTALRRLGTLVPIIVGLRRYCSHSIVSLLIPCFKRTARGLDLLFIAAESGRSLQSLAVGKGASILVACKPDLGLPARCVSYRSTAHYPTSYALRKPTQQR